MCNHDIWFYFQQLSDHYRKNIRLNYCLIQLVMHIRPFKVVCISFAIILSIATTRDARAKTFEIGDLQLDIPDRLAAKLHQSGTDPSSRWISIKVSALWPEAKPPATDILTITVRPAAIRTDFWCRLSKESRQPSLDQLERRNGAFSVLRERAEGVFSIYVWAEKRFLSKPLVLWTDEETFANASGVNLGRIFEFRRAITKTTSLEVRFLESTVAFDRIPAFLGSIENNLQSWIGRGSIGVECD